MEKRIKDFSDDQKIFMEENGIDFSSIDEVLEKVGSLLMRKGFDLNYRPTKIGIMCESILDSLPELEGVLYR